MLEPYCQVISQACGNKYPKLYKHLKQLCERHKIVLVKDLLKDLQSGILMYKQQSRKFSLYVVNYLALIMRLVELKPTKQENLYALLTKISDKFEKNWFCYQNDVQAVAVDIKLFVSEIDKNLNNNSDDDENDKQQDENHTGDENQNGAASNLSVNGASMGQQQVLNVNGGSMGQQRGASNVNSIVNVNQQQGASNLNSISNVNQQSAACE